MSSACHTLQLLPALKRSSQNSRRRQKLEGWRPPTILSPFFGEISLLSSFDGRYELATPSSNPYSKENLNKNTPRAIHLENPKGTKTPI